MPAQLGLELPAVRSKPRRFCSPTEAEALLAALPIEDRPLWATAFYAGLRRGELVALQWEDVDLPGGEIHVRHGWDAVEGEIEPKSRKGKRKVSIPTILHAHLDRHWLATEQRGRVFGSARNVRARAESAAKVWRAAGLKPVTLHDCRHTYASLMIAAMSEAGKLNPKTLSVMMGHANIQITFDLYGHLMPGSEDEAAGALDAYMAREVGSATPPGTSPDAVEIAA